MGGKIDINIEYETRILEIYKEKLIQKLKE